MEQFAHCLHRALPKAPNERSTSRSAGYVKYAIGLAPSKLRPRWRCHFHFQYALSPRLGDAAVHCRAAGRQ